MNLLRFEFLSATTVKEALLLISEYKEKLRVLAEAPSLWAV